MTRLDGKHGARAKPLTASERQREAQAEEALRDARTMQRLLRSKWAAGQYLHAMVASLELHYERSHEKVQRDEVIAHCIRSCRFSDETANAMKADFSRHWQPDLKIINGGKESA